MLEGSADTGGWMVLSAMTSAKPSPLKSALTTPLENSVGLKPAHPKQPLPSLQLASSAHATARGNLREVTRNSWYNIPIFHPFIVVKHLSLTSLVYERLPRKRMVFLTGRAVSKFNFHEGPHGCARL
jgi:hypothetical protein